MLNWELFDSLALNSNGSSKLSLSFSLEIEPVLLLKIIEMIGNRAQMRKLITLLNLSVLGYSFVVFHDKAKRTQ